MNTDNSGEINTADLSWCNSCWLNLSSAADGHVSLRGEYKGIQRAFLLAYLSHLVTVLYFERDCRGVSSAPSYSVFRFIYSV